MIREARAIGVPLREVVHHIEKSAAEEPAGTKEAIAGQAEGGAS
jgi:hypothetical protein